MRHGQTTTLANIGWGFITIKNVSFGGASFGLSAGGPLSNEEDNLRRFYRKERMSELAGISSNASGSKSLRIFIRLAIFLDTSFGSKPG